MKHVNNHILLRKLWRCWKPNCPKKQFVRLNYVHCWPFYSFGSDFVEYARIDYLHLVFIVTFFGDDPNDSCAQHVLANAICSAVEQRMANNWTIDNWKQNILIRSLFGRSFAFLIRPVVSSLVCFGRRMANRAQNAEKITLNYIKKNSSFLIYCIWLRSSFPSIRWNAASLLRSPPDQHRANNFPTERTSRRILLQFVKMCVFFLSSLFGFWICEF